MQNQLSGCAACDVVVEDLLIPGDVIQDAFIHDDDGKAFAAGIGDGTVIKDDLGQLVKADEVFQTLDVRHVGIAVELFRHADNQVGHFVSESNGVLAGDIRLPGAVVCAADIIGIGKCHIAGDVADFGEQVVPCGGVEQLRA